MPKYLLTNEAITALLWKLLETNPAYSEDLRTKAQADKDPVCTNFYLWPGQSVTHEEFPDISRYKDGWRTGILNGRFAAGTWTFRIRLENDTKYGFSVKVTIRLSKSAAADGSNGTLIVTSSSPNVLALPAQAGGSVSDSWTCSVPETTFVNEYLFAEYRIHIEVAGQSLSCLCSFACDEDPSVADESVETTTLTAAYVRAWDENLSVIGDRHVRTVQFSRVFKLDLSVLRDIFAFIYMKAPIIRKLVETLIISMTFVRRYSGVRAFREDLSSTSDVFSRIAAYKRRLTQQTLIRDVFKRTLSFPRVFREDLSSIRDRLTRIVSRVRAWKLDLSAIADKFSFVYTPFVPPVYKFVQNLSVISVRFKKVHGIRRAFRQNLSVLRALFIRRANYFRKQVEVTYVQVKAILKKIVVVIKKWLAWLTKRMRLSLERPQHAEFKL